VHAKVTSLKLVPCWFIGQRDTGCAYHFMYELKPRLVSRVQLTIDGHKPHFVAVEGRFRLRSWKRESPIKSGALRKLWLYFSKIGLKKH
jgi:hypothetical protein